MFIKEFDTNDIPKVKEFTDLWIGRGYYQEDQLAEMLDWSRVGNLNCSFIAYDNSTSNKKVIGVRLSFAPGEKWQNIPQLSPELWQVPRSTVSYFKSLFVSDEYQGKGLGKLLSLKSLEVMKLLGGRAIICHSWLESPNNSSQKYLEKIDFKKVTFWPNFWKEIDYYCTRCGKPCVCTACEMIKYI
jgi:hypothetical protein